MQSFDNVHRDTCVTVVNWVNSQLLPRLYHSFTVDQFKEQLLNSVENDGAGLNTQQFEQIKGGTVVTILDKIKNGEDNEIKELFNSWLQRRAFQVKVVGKSITLNDLEVARIAQRNKLINASSVMPFIGDSELFKIVEPVLTKLVVGEFEDKQPIMFFAGSPGIGKTRNAVECIELVKKGTRNELLKKFLETKVEIYLQLGRNGMQFGKFECDKHANERHRLTEELLANMIAIRLCYIFDKFYLERTFEPTNWAKIINIEQFTLFIKSMLNVSKLTLVVVIDEFQNLTQFKDPETDRSGLDIVVKVLGNNISTLAKLDIVFVPIFSGLERRNLLGSLSKSTYPPLPIIPTRTRMSFFDFSIFIQNYIEVRPKQATKLGLTRDNFLTHPKLQTQYSKSYGNPRSIEHLMNNLLTLDTWEQIDASPFVHVSSGLDQRMLDIIFAYFLTEVVITPTSIVGGCEQGKSFEELETRGLFKLAPVDQNTTKFKIEPFFPLTNISYEDSQFWEFASIISNIVSKTGVYSLNSTVLNAQYLFAKSCAFRLLGKDSIPFSKMFNGLLPSLVLSNSQLWKEGLIKLNTFNTSIHKISKTDDSTQPGCHYIFPKTQHKKGCDRKTIFDVLYGETCVSTTILFQDIGMDWNTSGTSQTSLSNFTNSNVVEQAKLNILFEKKDPNTILAYFSTKNYKRPMFDCMTTDYTTFTETQVQISSIPCIILGNFEENSACSLEQFYGKTIYHGLFLVNIPKVINLCNCEDWLLELLLNIHTKKELKIIKKHAKSCKSLDDFLNHKLINSENAKSKMTTDVTSTDTRIVVLFEQDEN